VLHSFIGRLGRVRSQYEAIAAAPKKRKFRGGFDDVLGKKLRGSGAGAVVVGPDVDDQAGRSAVGEEDDSAGGDGGPVELDAGGARRIGMMVGEGGGAFWRRCVERAGGG